MPLYKPLSIIKVWDTFLILHALLGIYESSNPIGAEFLPLEDGEFDESRVDLEIVIEKLLTFIVKKKPSKV